MPLGSRIIRYVRDGRTDTQVDRQTDGRTKATLIDDCRLSYGRGIIMLGPITC